MSTISNYNFDNESIIREELKSKPLERIASLDFQRGLAIFIMVFIHSASNIIDSSYIVNDPSIIGEMPIYIIVVLAFLAFFGMWNSYFLLISTTVNSYTMSKGAIQGRDLKKILLKQLLSGIALLVIHTFQNSFLAKGYLGIALETGDWTNTYPLWRGFFSMGTLRIIGYCTIVNSILLFFLLKKEGYKKFYRNIIILGSLALIVIVSSEFINNWVDSLNWIQPDVLPVGVTLPDNVWWPNEDFQALNYSVKSWFCTIISGDIEPLLPFLASGLIGGIIGLCLAQPEKIKRMNLYGSIFGLVCLSLGAVLIFLGFFTFGTSRPPIGNYLVMLGGQLCVFFLLFYLVEYRGNAQKFGNNRIVKHFRLWGMISLTLFALDILDIVPRILFGLLYNLFSSVDINTIPGKVFGSGQEHFALIYALFAILFYELLIYLWSKVNFYLSIEWIIIQVIGKLTKDPSKRLDVKMVLNEVKWIQYSSKPVPS
ncbi:MAG: hypothetical protein ACFFDW_10190 [Candidatus Thorarchaeota archaeon]